MDTKKIYIFFLAEYLTQNLVDGDNVAKPLITLKETYPCGRGKLE